MSIEIIILLILVLSQIVVFYKLIKLEKMLKPAPEVSDDILVEEAKKVITEAGKASASLVQRRLKIGYARAARILDILEGEGFVAPFNGGDMRKIPK